MTKVQNFVAQGLFAGLMIGVNLTGLLTAQPRYNLLFLIGLIPAVVMVVLLIVQVVQYPQGTASSDGGMNTGMKQWLADVDSAKEARGLQPLSQEEKLAAVQGFEAGWINSQNRAESKS